MERAGRLALAERALDGRDVGPARVEGEGGGEQVGAGEHRLALGEVRHRPVHGLLRSGLRRSGFHAYRTRLAIDDRATGFGLAPGVLCGVPGHRLRRESARIEPEPCGLVQPALAQLVAVDVALGRAGHQRRALGEALIVRGGAAAALSDRRLDLGAPALQALLFRHLYWHANLSQFVETFPRGLPGGWPQHDIGVILWGLSNVAGEWQSADTLRTLTAVRDGSVAGLHWNAEGTMFAGRVLGPLRWFGLLEYRGPPETAEVGWRKTALFDRFLSFDVRRSQERGTGH